MTSFPLKMANCFTWNQMSQMSSGRPCLKRPMPNYMEAMKLWGVALRVKLWLTFQVIFKVWGLKVLIFHTKLCSLLNHMCMVDAYSKGHVIHKILSASMVWCSLMEMWAWGIYKERPLSAHLHGEMPNLLTCHPPLKYQDLFMGHPSLLDQDCILSAGVWF